jgi:hypothetical protein
MIPETPIAQSEIEAPSAFATAGMRAELADAEAASHPEPIAEIELPKSIADTITRIREGMAVRPGSKTEAKVKEAGLVRLRAHLLAISQGQSAPRIDHKAFFKREVSASALAFIEAQYPKTKTRKV